jgi:fructose-bisphosphate aldolase class II
MASASELLQLITIPQVLHGGSGNNDSDVAESIRYDVGKINISSDMKNAFFVALEQDVQEPNSLLSKPMQAAIEVVAAKIALFFSVGKAS